MIIKNDKSDFESYLVDEANFKGNCKSVYFPESESEIYSILKEANNTKTKVTISAARTGLNGGCVPQDGILISTEKLNKIISIDTDSKNAVIQPGVILCDLQKKVESLKLFYPPDPTETNCTLGGNVATNASGARTFKYGSTRNFVEEISIILPTGESTTIKRGEYFSGDNNIDFITEDGKTINLTLPNYKMPEVKHAAGYFNKNKMDLIDLFIGSEGTLGILTKIKLKLINLPQNVLSMIIFFDNENNIFSFVNDIRLKSIDNSNKLDLREIEFFDKNSLNILRTDFPNIPKNAKGAVWIEQEFELADEENILQVIDKRIEVHKGNVENIWFALNQKEQNELKKFRHAIPIKVNEIISSRELFKIGTDTAVPDDKFDIFYNYTKHLIKEHNLDYVVYGHVGNSHLHFNMLPKDKDELLLCRQLYRKICTKSVKLGGTISAEHGIGKLKTNYLLDMFGKENILQMAKLKKSLDPNMILNVGNIFDESLLKIV